MKKNIIGGLFFIAIAVFLLAGGFGVFSPISIWKLIFTLVLVYVLYKGLRHIKFIEIMPALALLYLLYASDIIKAVPYLQKFDSGVVMIASVFLGIGLDMIFKKSFHHDRIIFGSHDSVNEDDGDGHQETAFSSQSADVNLDHFDFENCFGEVSKYISSDCFQKGKADNSFGQMNIYMDNVIVQDGAKLKLENNFGQTNVYLPSNVRVNLVQDSSFGKVRLNGQCQNAENDPNLFINAESNFGQIDIYFR